MSAALRSQADATAIAGSPAAMPRILPRPPATGLGDHHGRYGTLPLLSRRDLIREVLASGLRGRGGAGFPTATKLQAVADGAGRGWRRHGAVVVANGTEGEPASAKDKVLLRVSPHLVLDGMVAAGVAVGADRGVLCIDRRDRGAILAAERAVAERRGRDPVDLSVAGTPSRYIAGEESALVSWINDGEAKPAFVPPRPYQKGVGGLPTLVDNVETLANIGLIARFGGAEWRSVGSPEEPGSVLVTITGAVATPGVYEVEMGAPIGALLARSGARDLSGVLVGGYFGTWLSAEDAGQAAMSSAGLRAFGASPGCGVIAALPAGRCPLQEVAAVLHWLAANSAGQCGPCTNGLPALAGAFDALVGGDRTGASSAKLDRWSPMVVRRGACGLPDGAVRFLDSARAVFAEHIEAHRRRGPCPRNSEQLLPTPALGGWR